MSIGRMTMMKWMAELVVKLQTSPMEQMSVAIYPAIKIPRKTFEMAKVQAMGLRQRPETGKSRAKKNSL